MRKFGKSLALWLIVVVLLVALFNLFQSSPSRRAANGQDYSEFVGEVDRGQVSDVTIQGHVIFYRLSDKRGSYSTYAPEDPDLVRRLLGQHVNFKAVPVHDDASTLLGVFTNWFPMLLLIGVWVYFTRRMARKDGSASEPSDLK